MPSTLTQLSQEYYDAAKKLDETIEKYRALLQTAYAKGNYLKTYEIKKKLAIFYDQKRDVITTAHLLEHYYDKEDKHEYHKIVS